MIVRELTTRLGFDADDAQARRYADSIRTVRRVALAATAAVTALAGGTIALSRSLARQGDEIAKASVEAGLAEDQFQRLTFAIGQVSRVSERQAEQALLRLNDTIGRARIEGGRYAESLERLGFSQEEIQAGTIDNEEAFSRVVTELGNTENAADAAALASRVLGERVGRQLGPALRESGDDFRNAAAEVAALGGGFSQVASQSAEQLTDSFARVGIITRSLRSEIAEQLLPVVNDLVTELTDWFSANREIILQNFRRVVAGFITVLRTLTTIVRGVATAVNAAAQAIGGWERVIRLTVAALTALAAVKIFRFLRALGVVIGGLIAAIGTFAGAIGALKFGAIIAGVGAVIVAVEDLIGWMQGADSVIGRLLGSFEDFSARVKPIADFFAGALRVMIDQFAGLLDFIIGIVTLDGQRIIDGFLRIWNPISQGFLELQDIIVGVFSRIISAVAGFVSDMVRAILGAVGRVFGASSELGEGIRSGFLGAIAGVFSLDLSAIVDSITGFIGRAIAAGVDLASQIAGAFARSIAGAFSVDMSGLAGSIRSFGADAVDAARSVGGRIRDGFMGAVGSLHARIFGDDDAPEMAQPTGDPRQQGIAEGMRQLGVTGTPDIMSLPVVPRSQPSVNVNANFNIDVPPGTTEQQQSVLQGTIERVFDQRLDRAIRQSMQDFQPQE